MRTLIGGVGYDNLRDLSLGPVLTNRLAAMAWPENVVVDRDLSFGPITIVYRFQDLPDPYQRVVLFGAVNRGRPPGTITTYHWSGQLPPVDEIQARIGEALTGVVSLDNLLIIGGYFGIWPQEVTVIEVEPADEGWGPGFSPTVTCILDEIIAAVRRVVLVLEQ